MVKTFFQRYVLQFGIFFVLIALLIIFMILSPSTFLSKRIYISFMSTIPFAAIMALGLTLVIISGDMDLSFPSVMAISGFTFSSLFLSTGNGLIALVLALFVGMIAGIVNGLIVVKVGVPSIIATIGMQFFWRGLTTLLCEGMSKNIVPIRDTLVHKIFVGRAGGMIPAQSIWFVIIAVYLWSLLNRHKFGDSIRFIGDNIKTARIMGINVDLIRILIFMQMGLLTSFSGILVCFEMANWWPTQGEGYMLLVFASVFIGGTSVFGGQGTIIGTSIGSIIIGIIEAGIISSGFSGFWTRLIYGIIVVASVSVYAVMTKKRAY